MSPFVFQYSRLRDLTLRAKAWQQLFDPVLPGIFLAWAKRTGIDVASKLTEAVENQGVQIADWKSLYEKATTAFARQTEVHESQIADWKRLYDESLAQMEAQRAD
jgi:hypothetical protein